MRDREYTDASLFLAQYFGSTTTHAVEIRALSNERGAGRAAPLFTRDPADIETHCRRWDSIGRAVYFGTATRLLGHGSGRREDLAELPGLWADIDCAKLGLDKGLAAHTIGSDLYIKPSVIIDSGYGIHGHWLFRESLDIQLELPGAAELEADILAALKQLAGVVAGDIAVCDLARVMRLPGTHNTKHGELAPCRVLEASWARYEYGEVLDWLDWQRPVLVSQKGAGGDRKKSARRPADGRPAESDAFARYAATAGIKPPIDVGARLAAMEHLGVGDGSIHQTQLHVSASMVAHGADDEAIVALLMAATHEAGGLYGEHWNWAREEKNVRAMISSARAKFEARPASEEPASEAEQEEAESAADEKVVNFAEAAREQKRARGRPKKDEAPGQAAKESLIAKIGDAVIDYWRDTHGPLRVVEARPFTYTDGAWEMWSDGTHHVLKCAIQGVLNAGKIDPKTQLLNAVYRYIIERPDLLAENVEWDMTGYIVCKDAVLKPRLDGTWDAIPHSPDHWATRRIEIRISDMAQGRPRWLEFLDGCFSDRSEEERKAVIGCLQEWFGAALVNHKPRELRKALWLYGESRTGKTRVLEVLRALVGEPNCSMKLRSLATHFGPAALIGKRGWIADDAVAAKDEIDDAAFKCVVTGEAFSTDVKASAYATTRFDMPVAFSSNVLPRVKDQSDAVFNRSILIPMHVVRSEEETAGKPMIEDIVRTSEMAGVFAWSLEGWARLQARGRFLPPASIQDASDAFKDANNAALAWAKIGLVADPFYMVDRRDLYASFKGWHIAEHGADARMPQQKILLSGLRQGLNVGHDMKMRHGGIRFMPGVRLTEEGLAFRDECPRQPGGGDSHSGVPTSQVNRLSGGST